MGRLSKFFYKILETDPVDLFENRTGVDSHYPFLSYELIKLNLKTGYFRKAPREADLKRFQQSLLNIPSVAVRSYRDDLINSKVSEDRLCFHGLPPSLDLMFLIAIAAVNLYVFFRMPLTEFFKWSFITSLSFWARAQFRPIPRIGMIRRIKFAEWLDAEILRRGRESLGE